MFYEHTAMSVKLLTDSCLSSLSRIKGLDSGNILNVSTELNENRNQRCSNIYGLGCVFERLLYYEEG